MLVISYGNSRWNCWPASLEAVIKLSHQEGGFYKDITAEANVGGEHPHFNAIVLGQRDALFLFSVDPARKLNYWLGYLQESHKEIDDAQETQ